MPQIISLLLSGLISLVSSLVGRVLVSLALGFVEYQGISTLISTVTDQAMASLASFEGSALPGVLAWAGFFRLDVHISILISAIGVKVALNAMGGDKIRRLVRK